MKYSLFLLFVLVFLESCSIFSNRLYLTSKTEYLQGKIIYEMIQPEAEYFTSNKANDLKEGADKLDSCKQYLLAVYVLSKGLKNSAGSVTGYTSFNTNLVSHLEFHTSVFRGEYNCFAGVIYYSKTDARRDLRDWKRILKCN